jgi:hypothetical protein
MHETKLALDAANRGPDGIDQREKRAALQALGRYLGGIVETNGPNGTRGTLRIQDGEQTRKEVSAKLHDHYLVLSQPELMKDRSLDYYRTSLEKIGGSLERGQTTLTAVKGQLYGVACDAEIGHSPRIRPLPMGKGPSDSEPAMPMPARGHDSGR